MFYHILWTGMKKYTVFFTPNVAGIKINITFAPFFSKSGF